MFVLTLALAVHFFVSFFRLLRTISRRSGFVTSKASFINSSVEGSLVIGYHNSDSVCQDSFSYGSVPMGDKDIDGMKFLFKLDPCFQ